MAFNTSVESATATLTREIKEIKEKCLETCNIIGNNAYLEMQGFTPDNLNEKALTYVDGLRSDLESTDAPIVTDKTRITNEFLNELTENISQVEELIAYKRGAIIDMDAEILRIKHQINIAEDAKSRQTEVRPEVTVEHLQAAKQQFHEMKSQVQGLIQSLYPQEGDEMVQILGTLMQEKLNEESNGYVEIESKYFNLIKMIEDMGIVTTNPYNKREYKLAY